MGSAEHVGGMARARGVSRAHDWRREPVPTPREFSWLRCGCDRPPGQAFRDLLVEGGTGEVAVRVLFRFHRLPFQLPVADERVQALSWEC